MPKINPRKILALKRFATKQNGLIALVIACGIGLLITGIAIGNKTASQPETDTERPVLAEDIIKNSQNASADIPLESSAVCTAVTKEKLAQALNQEIEFIAASVSNTTTTEGTVSGCSYRTVATDGQKVGGGVTIIERKLADTEASTKAFNTLAKSKRGSMVNVPGSDAAYQQNDAQLIVRKDSRVVTITITRPLVDQDNAGDTLKAISRLL